VHCALEEKKDKIPTIYLHSCGSWPHRTYYQILETTPAREVRMRAHSAKEITQGYSIGNIWCNDFSSWTSPSNFKTTDTHNQIEYTNTNNTKFLVSKKKKWIQQQQKTQRTTCLSHDSLRMATTNRSRNWSGTQQSAPLLLQITATKMDMTFLLSLLWVVVREEPVAAHQG
jgi:hypothetical protein